jgi:uroporphyrin-III C-methyltransferase/precorrin-2 dehydrogenase/sirohydrochlorin ferrochelatase
MDLMSEAKSGTQSREPMGELSVLPVFFALEGKRAVLAGATGRAVWKAELLNAAGAALDVIAPEPCEEMRALLALCPRARLVQRVWQPSDLAGAALALVDTDIDAEAAAFQAAAKAAGVPVNAIDKPAFCDFQFGALVNRSPLVIGISTHGAAPVFAQAIRGRLETLLPANIQAWAQAARQWRARLNPLHLPFQARRAFWERFSRRALDTRDAAPDEVDFDEFLGDPGAEQVQSKGRVTLVGAGPGDPGLITLKALRALQGADVVLYDNLVAPEIVEMARREAQKIDVGKRGYRPSCRQEDITALMIELGRAGKNVVRLKGGDPMIFGRANEEIAALSEAGVPVEVIPGITAALGAAASLRISLTERDLARRLQFVTAHARDGRLPEDIDWAALCDRGAATVVYMGVKTMDALVARLLGQGMDPATPAILVERATQPGERSIAAAIAEMPAKAAAARPDGPCLLMIGQVFAPAHLRVKSPTAI